MIALIDGDIICYRVGFTTQNDDEWVASVRVDELINNILFETEATGHIIFLTSTDKSNYRFKLYDQYKANRKQEKPIHYTFIRNYLEEVYNAQVVYGEEADDALGYTQTEDSTICSIDKDLLMIPGKHYNFVKKELYNVTKEQALYNFYWQILEGDKGTDNIPGCPGIGKQTIPKLIIPEMTELEMFTTVYNTYKKQYEKKQLPNFESDLLRNARLLKIKQSKDEPLWEFPKE